MMLLSRISIVDDYENDDIDKYEGCYAVNYYYNDNVKLLLTWVVVMVMRLKTVILIMPPSSLIYRKTS